MVGVVIVGIAQESLSKGRRSAHSIQHAADLDKPF